MPCSAEAQVISGGIVRRLLIAYFTGNISAKKYQNSFMCVKVIASQRWDVFLRHGVVSYIIAKCISVLLYDVHLSHLNKDYLLTSLL